MTIQTFSQHDAEGIEKLLVGHRIVAAEEGDFARPEQSYYRASGRLTLDDGTQILVTPNEGGCACSAGDYSLASIAAVDNIITAVRLVDESRSDGDPWVEDATGRYQIFVVADAVEVNVLTVEGDDGNGYYGTGYELMVIPPSP